MHFTTNSKKLSSHQLKDKIHFRGGSRISSWGGGGGGVGVGGALKKIAQSAGKFWGVFRVKNHDFTPTNHIFSNFRGGGGGGGVDPPLHFITVHIIRIKPFIDS